MMVDQPSNVDHRVHQRREAGAQARSSISRAKTSICQGYSKILTPVRRNLPICQDPGVVTDSGLNDQGEPVSIFDQNRQVAAKKVTVNSQKLNTFVWL